MRWRVVLAASCVMLSACSILPQAEPTDVYMLPRVAASTASVPGAAFAGSLRIVKPQTNQILDTPRIAVTPKGALIAAYHGARWSDPAPSLLRNRLLDIFQSDGRIGALSSDDSNLHTDFELGGNLQAFQSQYVGQGVEVLIRFDARLVDNRQRIVASRRFEVHQPSQGVELAQVVNAFGQASDALGGQLLGWTMSQIQTAKNPQAKNQ